MSGFCIDCGLRVESFEGLEKCPNCNSASVPCYDENQVNISINWQELRILSIWAERWALEKRLGAGIIYSIAGRIEKQYPSLAPLTFAGELHQLKDEGYDVETNFPGVEL